MEDDLKKMEDYLKKIKDDHKKMTLTKNRKWIQP